MKRKLTTTLLSGLMAGSFSIAGAQSPKIVVGIVVDQLRTDYIEQLRPYFGDKGFNRLINQGVYIPDVDFRNTVKDAPSGTAVIYTGAWPATNGVASAETLDKAQRRSIPALSDPSKSRLEFSPENLTVSTVTDEYFINNGNLSKIYSIAADPQVAVVTAAHAGNAAIWLDENTGKWTSPAYYGALPAVVSNKNRTSPLSTKISSTVWRPLNQPSIYPGSSTWNDGNFSYSFSGTTRDGINKYKGSAYFNTEITDAAIDIIKSKQAGPSGFINIAYSLAPINFDYDGDNRPELVDSYMRLDSDLGRLFEELDKEYGAGNAMVFLASTGYAVEPAIPDEGARIPTGEITLKQAESLLNSYLSATYGNGDYVSLIRKGKLYLDSNAASKKGIDIKRLRVEAKDFLLRMGGISEAFTIDEVLTSDNQRARDMALGVNPKNAPDLFLFYTPGWTVTDDNAYPSVSEKVRMAVPSTPAFIMTPEVEAQVVTTPVEATSLAPTISSALRIRAPNAAASKPILLHSSQEGNQKRKN